MRVNNVAVSVNSGSVLPSASYSLSITGFPTTSDIAELDANHKVPPRPITQVEVLGQIPCYQEFAYLAQKVSAGIWLLQKAGIRLGEFVWKQAVVSMS